MTTMEVTRADIMWPLTHYVTTYTSHHRRDDHEWCHHWWQPEVLHNTSTDDQLWGDWNWPNVTTCPDSDHRRNDLIRFDQISTWSNSPFPPLTPITATSGEPITKYGAGWSWHQVTTCILMCNLDTVNKSQFVTSTDRVGSWRKMYVPSDNVNMWLWWGSKVSRQIFTCYDVTIHR